MKLAIDCIPCFLRQALESVRIATDDPALHEQAVRELIAWLPAVCPDDTPPAVAQRIHRRLREISGNADPYKPAKDRFNRLALAMRDDLSAMIDASDDPLDTALRVAVAANVIDLGVNGGLTEPEARAAIGSAMHVPLHGRVDALREAIAPARRILFLADNAGEIVLDKLLIDRLPAGRVTVAVRGGPILNDANAADAALAGIDPAITIDNGSDAPGTVLTDCNEAFLRHYRWADLVLAKGQGNFETLSDEPEGVFFLFKAKCPAVAAHAGLPLGAHVLTSTGEIRRAASRPATPRNARTSKTPMETNAT